METRKSRRWGVDEAGNRATLRWDGWEIAVALEDRSAGGFAAVVPSATGPKVEQRACLKWQDDWYTVKVSNHRIAHGQLHLGLTILDDHPDPKLLPRQGSLRWVFARQRAGIVPLGGIAKATVATVWLAVLFWATVYYLSHCAGRTLLH